MALKLLQIEVAFTNFLVNTLHTVTHLKDLNGTMLYLYVSALLALIYTSIILS